MHAVVISLGRFGLVPDYDQIVLKGGQDQMVLKGG